MWTPFNLKRRYDQNVYFHIFSFYTWAVAHMKRYDRKLMLACYKASLSASYNTLRSTDFRKTWSLAGHYYVQAQLRAGNSEIHFYVVTGKVWSGGWVGSSMPMKTHFINKATLPWKHSMATQQKTRKGEKQRRKNETEKCSTVFMWPGTRWSI